jgi:hypothetical protein
MLADDRQQRNPASSRLMQGFGAMRPRQYPEEWRQIRSDMEAAMAEEEVKVLHNLQGGK